MARFGHRTRNREESRSEASLRKSCWSDSSTNADIVQAVNNGAHAKKDRAIAVKAVAQEALRLAVPAARPGAGRRVLSGSSLGRRRRSADFPACGSGSAAVFVPGGTRPCGLRRNRPGAARWPRRRTHRTPAGGCRTAGDHAACRGGRCPAAARACVPAAYANPLRTAAGVSECGRSMDRPPRQRCACVAVVIRCTAARFSDAARSSSNDDGTW
jgi:hypothetical protein